jgi:peroxiredoxin
VRDDIVPGGTFPDYELTDHAKQRRRLSELQGNDPMILVLSRGHYCPKDHQQHLELAAAYSKIAVAYTQVVTISTDNIVETREFRASVGAQWTFLSDAGRHVQKDLDIQEYTDPHHNPMIPYTLVLKPGLVIHSIYNGYWFWGRPSIDAAAVSLRSPAIAASSCRIRQPSRNSSRPSGVRRSRVRRSGASASRAHAVIASRWRSSKRTIVRRWSVSSSERSSSPARLSSPTSVLVVERPRPSRAASSLTLSEPEKVTVNSAGRCRLPSEPRSFASRNTTGGGLAAASDRSV